MLSFNTQKSFLRKIHVLDSKKPETLKSAISNFYTFKLLENILMDDTKSPIYDLWARKAEFSGDKKILLFFHSPDKELITYAKNYNISEEELIQFMHSIEAKMVETRGDPAGNLYRRFAQIFYEFDPSSKEIKLFRIQNYEELLLGKRHCQTDVYTDVLHPDDPDKILGSIFFRFDENGSPNLFDTKFYSPEVPKKLFFDGITCNQANEELIPEIIAALRRRNEPRIIIPDSIGSYVPSISTFTAILPNHSTSSNSTSASTHQATSKISNIHQGSLPAGIRKVRHQNGSSSNHFKTENQVVSFIDSILARQIDLDTISAQAEKFTSTLRNAIELNSPQELSIWITDPSLQQKVIDVFKIVGRISNETELKYIFIGNIEEPRIQNLMLKEFKSLGERGSKGERIYTLKLVKQARLEFHCNNEGNIVKIILDPFHNNR